MTLAYGCLTLGSLFLFSALTGKSMIDIITGTGGPGTVSDQPLNTTADANAASGSGGSNTKVSLDSSAKGTVTMDGKPVCASIAKILDQARKDGVHFTVLSGYRTVAESVAACQRICGQPTCEGTCAGATSNHNGCSPGAVDIGSGCEELRGWLAKHGNPIFNALPQDTCHFSATGH